MSFDQSLRDVTKSLTDLANATPNEFISQEMVDQAKTSRGFEERYPRIP